MKYTTDSIRVLLDKHTPSITDAVEEELWSRMISDGNEDVADFALRQCACGRRIEDFYDYVMHHLKEEVFQ